MKNKYYKRSHISEAQFRAILQCFSNDFDSYSTAEISGVSRQSVQRYFNKLRKRIVEWVVDEKPFSGEVEVDESYFGPRRVRGKRGRGAGKKVLVLGILKRGGSVHTQIISNADKENILPILQGKVLDETTVHTDGWRSYDGLIDIKNFKHYEENLISME